MQVEWIILSEAAQVVDGKLYLLGGGWKLLTVNIEFPVQQQMGVAVSYEVPWEETNVQQHSQLEVQTQDGQALVSMNIALEVGRAAGLPIGPQRSQFAVNFGLSLPGPGTYAVVVRVEGQEARQTEFHVIAPNAGRILPRIG